MHANRDNSANSTGRPLLQIERLMSDEKCLERRKIYLFLPFQGDKVLLSNERCLLTLNFDAKNNSRSEVERAFELLYFSNRQAVIKIIVQGGNTDK